MQRFELGYGQFGSRNRSGSNTMTIKVRILYADVAYRDEIDQPFCQTTIAESNQSRNTNRRFGQALYATDPRGAARDNGQNYTNDCI